MDFNQGEGDKIDIADIITGYTQGVDDLTKFVEITDDGTDSFLKVDQTGSGNFTSNVITTIKGVTGLIDEVVLETSGTLITS